LREEDLSGFFDIVVVVFRCVILFVLDLKRELQFAVSTVNKLLLIHLDIIKKMTLT